MASPARSSAQPLRVALIWNGALYDELLLTKPRPVVLGSGKRAMFPLPDGVTEEEDVTLLELRSGGYSLQPAQGMGGSVWLSGRQRSARKLREPVALGAGDYGLVTFGGTSLFFQQVRPVQGRVPRKAFRDGALVACLGLSVFAHVASLVFLFLVAAQELSPIAGLELDSELLRKFLVVPPPEDPVAAARRSQKESEERGLRDRDEAGGKRAKDKQGRVGKRDATRSKTEIAGAPADAVAQQVRGLGLLGVLSGGRSNAVSSALDTPSLDNLLGGLGAAQTVLGRGSGGLSTRGSGSGGGGTANGSLFGAGELGTGVSGGKGLGHGGGKGLGDGRGTHEAQLSLGASGPRVSGFLSAEQINRVVQANRAALKYCFETALQRKPKLQGSIDAYWRIDRKGVVSTTRVAKSTLDDPGVEGCILRQIKRWKFPEPDGGEVDVTYPFLFRGQ